MFLNRKVFSLFVIAALAIGCSAEPAIEEGSTEDTVIVDTAAIEAAIDGINTQFEAAVAATDTIAIANLYAEDAIIQPPDMPRGEGRDAVRGVFAGLLSPTTGTTVALDTDKVIVAESGELATEIGTYSVSGTMTDGTAWSDNGKNIRVWKNIDGTWQIVADTWNSDNPVPGMDDAAPAEDGV